MKTDTLILGAGLTGLSCAYHLEKRGIKNYLLAEKSARTGGLCGSFKQDGFTFDWSGHALHTHTPQGEKLIKKLLGKNIVRVNRNAWIYSQKTFTGYPFQANTYGLPPKVVSECVSEFIKAAAKNRTEPFSASFEKWALAVFGEGICKYFMFPYNRKLWQTPLNILTAQWCAPFVPRPKIEDVLRGAYWSQEKSFGYNSGFYYPRRGGCQAICDALAKNISGLKLNSEVISLDLRAKTARIKGMREVSYKNIVSTIPLKELMALDASCPAKITKAAKTLRHAGITVLNLGINRQVPDKHWVYFPEKKFPFYRTGLQSNFSKYISPANTTAFYIEMPGAINPRRRAAAEAEIIRKLNSCGLMSSKDRVLSKLWLDIPCAYVIYDKNREPALKIIGNYLKKLDCISTGRYGGWKYSFMEEAILDGKNAADKITG